MKERRVWDGIQKRHYPGDRVWEQEERTAIFSACGLKEAPRRPTRESARATGNAAADWELPAGLSVLPGRARSLRTEGTPKMKAE